MVDVRVSVTGFEFTVIELLTDHAKNWYADNVDGAPAVSSNSLTLDMGPTGRVVRGMVRAGLVVEVINGTLRDFDAQPRMLARLWRRLRSHTT